MAKVSPENRGMDFAGQHPDEQVQLVFHQHPVVMRKFLMASLIIFTISTLPLSFWSLQAWPWKVLAGGSLLALLVFFYRWISWYYSIYIVTNERLIQIKQKGFFDRRVADISHSKIQSVNYEVKGLQATLFHFGTIIVQTYVGDMILHYIHKPADVQQLLVKIIRTVKAVDPPNSDDDFEDKGELNDEI